jgi:HSP20 family protein
MTIRDILPRLWGEEQHPLRSLHQEMDNLFEGWTKNFGLPAEIWPRINVSETDKDMQITAELPGVDQKDIEITVTGSEISIKGQKKSEIDEKTEKEGRAYRRIERSYGSFQRRMSLPYDVDPNKVEASFKDGVLTLTLPKPPEVQKASKKIEITGNKQVESKKAA